MRVPRFSSLTYAAVWHGSQMVSDLFYRTEVAGLEHFPMEGPFLLASNHASFLDPPLVGSHMPRELTYFARKTLFQGRFGKLITDLNSIPIDRDGDSDLGAFRKVFSVLKDGGALLVFPEGTRSTDGSIGPARSGVGMIACRAKVPVLPVRIFGSYDIWSRNRKLPSLSGSLGITVGKVLPLEVFDPGKDDPDRYLTAAQRILAAIAALKPPAVGAV